MDKPCDLVPEEPETINTTAWKQVYAQHLAQYNNKTKAYQHAKPHVTYQTAQREGHLASKDPEIIKLVNKAINKQVDALRFSKEQILDNIDVIRSKTLKNKQFGVSLKANKELAELAGLYEKGVDDPGQYLTLIKSLTINTTISSGSPPKQVEHEVDAEFEDVDNAD